jgi:hypothetical protein
MRSDFVSDLRQAKLDKRPWRKLSYSLGAPFHQDAIITERRIFHSYVNLPVAAAARQYGGFVFANLSWD